MFMIYLELVLILPPHQNMNFTLKKNNKQYKKDCKEELWLKVLEINQLVLLLVLILMDPRIFSINQISELCFTFQTVFKNGVCVLIG